MHSYRLIGLTVCMQAMNGITAKPLLCCPVSLWSSPVEPSPLPAVVMNNLFLKDILLMTKPLSQDYGENFAERDKE